MKLTRKIAAVAVSSLMMFSMAGITASAATVTQDGLNVSLTTDKTEYKKDEAITATLTVENTGGTSVKDVKLENIVPEGYELAKDYTLTKSVDELKSNDKAELKVVYNAKTGGNVTPSNNSTTQSNTVTTNTTTTASSAATSTETAQTGDTAVAIVIIAVIVVSFGLGFLAVRKKKGRSLLSIALTVSMLGTAMAIISVKTNAAGTSKTIEVTEKIKADNNDKELKAKVTYTTNVVKPDNSDIEKIKDGKFVNNNQLFEVTDEQLEKLDSISRLIVNRVSYKLSNKKQSGNTGTADIIVYSPNLKTAFNESIEKSEKTMNIEDSDIIDKTKCLLLDNIEKAELLEYKFEVDLEKKDDNWIIVMTEPLANALTGNIEEVFLDTYGYSEE